MINLPIQDNEKYLYLMDNEVEFNDKKIFVSTYRKWNSIKDK
jgi:hypothetical protein